MNYCSKVLGKSFWSVQLSTILIIVIFFRTCQFLQSTLGTSANWAPQTQAKAPDMQRRNGQRDLWGAAFFKTTIVPLGIPWQKHKQIEKMFSGFLSIKISKLSKTTECGTQLSIYWTLQPSNHGHVSPWAPRLHLCRWHHLAWNGWLLGTIVSHN